MHSFITTVATISLFSCSALAAEPFTILDVAPPNAAAVVNVPDWSKMRENFDDSPYGKLWKEPQFQAFINKLWEDDKVAEGWKEFTDWLEKAEIEQDEIKHPTGATGLALWVDRHEPGTPPGVGMIVVADFGANAESMKEVIRRALENAQEEGDIELEEDKYAETVIWTVRELDDKDDKSDQADENAGTPFDDDTEEDDDSPMEEAIDDAFEKAHLVWIDNTLVVCNILEKTEEVIDFAGGKRMDGFGTSAAYTKSRAQHGEDLDIFGAFVFTNDIRGMIEEKVTEVGPLTGTPGQAGTVLTALGFGSFESASTGVRFLGETGAGESTLGVIMPEKTGLVSLFSSMQTAFVPPAFIPADTTQLFTFNVDFKRVFEILRGIVDTMPAAQRQQLTGGLQAFDAQFGPAVRALGPEMFITSTIRRPFEEGSQTFVIMTKTSDALAFANAFGGFAPMLGMETRDFNGSPIYEDKANEMAIGIGYGHVFAGSTVQVENIMRRAAHPDEAGLSGEERFTDAVRRLNHEGIFHEWSDSGTTIEYAIWSMKNAERLMMEPLEAEARENGYELDENDRKMFTEHIPEWYKYLPPAEVFTRYIGDSIFTIRSTAEGFEGKSVSMPPKKP